MNVIKLCGGIGNQLFQYAFGRAQENNGIEVRYDARWFKRHAQDIPNRSYRLNKFQIDLKFSFLGGGAIRENGFDLDLLKKIDRNFAGYWQYYGYSEIILPVLRREFCIKKEFHTEEFLNLRERIVNGDSVSIHVRRGDYIGHRTFGALPFQYYINAISASGVKGDLFIFSDDIPWCRKRFQQSYFSRKVTFIALEDYLDFELMKLCKHNIIANSSFSWWAAYLNDNPEKVVMAPIQTQWLKDSFTDVVEKRYPEDWIKITNEHV